MSPPKQQQKMRFVACMDADVRATMRRILARMRRLDLEHEPAGGKGALFSRLGITQEKLDELDKLWAGDQPSEQQRKQVEVREAQDRQLELELGHGGK